ncbi:hypothetical protein [Mesoterricola silvestris]|uniref:Autotransporter domain-containing protein n=1 Tax=Mesoterricola silvestris TaxID=2927979 RepID=A0AA48GVQ5_9BACT|nr:hypothetical protein [Mesoterricola silvestris]BDU74942.1 hypothetical protein METEAL_41160 [Mesoterricola silvestris]
MTTPRILIRTALAVTAAALPMAAQTPLFNDAPAFGGSKVFSEGINPLGNPARFDRAPAGWYLGYVDGDQRAQDNRSLFQDTTSADAAVVTSALGKLKDAPWVQRTRAYGLVGTREATNFGFTREEFHSATARPDLDPAHLSTASALQDNASYVDGRRAIVNRVHFGGGALASGTAAGFNLRVEQWSLGMTAPYLNQLPPGVYTFAPGGAFPYRYAADDLALGYSTTDRKSLMVALDAGFTTELAQGLRLGVTADQLNGKRLWDVTMNPQYRGALQIDMGVNTQLTLESDINGAMRMPFPVKQQSSSASLRYQVSPSVVFLVGGERRKIGDASVTRVGATLQMRTPRMFIAVGFQAGQDKPLKGLALMVN